MTKIRNRILVTNVSNRAYGETAPFPTARQSAAAYESERDLLPLESVFGWEQYGMIKPSRKTLLVCEIITRKVYLLTLWDGVSNY